MVVKKPQIFFVVADHFLVFLVPNEEQINNIGANNSKGDSFIEFDATEITD